jgi:hypothetical protein
MSNYQDVRNLASMLFSEAQEGYTHDLEALAIGLVEHYNFDLNYDQIEWIVQGVIAECAYKEGYNPESAVYDDELVPLGY